MIDSFKKRFAKPLPKVIVTTYGFKGEFSQIKAEFRDFFQKHKSLKVQAKLVNFPDAKVSDLITDSDDLDYITIKCSDKKVLEFLQEELSKNDKLKDHFIDYQRPVSFVASKKK
jgi:hypothetical protein